MHICRNKVLSKQAYSFSTAFSKQQRLASHFLNARLLPPPARYKVLSASYHV